VLANRQGLTVAQDYTTDREALRNSLENYTAAGMPPASPGMEGLLTPVPAPLAIPPQDARKTPIDPAKEQLFEHQYLTRNGGARRSRCLPSPGRLARSHSGTQERLLGHARFPPSELRGTVKSGWDGTIEVLNQANVATNAVDSNGQGGPPRRWGYGALSGLEEIAQWTGGALYARRDDPN
jgi:hypothetical protein